MTVLQARTTFAAVVTIPDSVTVDDLNAVLARLGESGLDAQARALRASRDRTEHRAVEAIPWHFLGQAPEGPGLLASIASVLVARQVELHRVLSRTTNKVALVDIDLLIPVDVDAGRLRESLVQSQPPDFAALLGKRGSPDVLTALGSSRSGATWLEPPTLSAGAHGPAYQYQWSGHRRGDFAIIVTGRGTPSVQASVTFGAICDALLRVPCNIEAATRTVLGQKSSILGDRNVLMLIVTSLHSAVAKESIENALSAIGSEADLEIICYPLQERVVGSGTLHYTGQRWHFVGHVSDQPGVLYRVTEIFAKNDMNIYESLTQVVGDPPLCTIDLDVVVQDYAPFAKVCTEYRTLAASLDFLKADYWPVTSY